MSDNQVPPTAPGGPDPYRLDPGQTPVYLDTSALPASLPSQPGMPQKAAGRAGKTAAIVAGTLLVVGGAAGGGYLVMSAAGGGGPQPEEAMPANAMAFVKIDLDPSVGQKVGALRFASKFPSAPAETRNQDGDLKKALVEFLQKDGQLKGIDYAADIKPWLGDRAGFAEMPPLAAGDQAGTVLALAVTDADKAKAGLAKLTATNSGTVCSVQTDWALCSDSQKVLDAAVAGAKKETLATSAVFVADQKALDRDGIIAFWANLPPLLKAVQEARGGTSVSDTLKDAGRTFGAVRFDGASLELVAKSAGSQTLHKPPVRGTRVGDLPADTVAALGFAGLDTMLAESWKRAEQAGGSDLASSLDSLRAQSGLDLPADLFAVLSPHLTVAFGGGDVANGEAVKVAALSDASPDTVRSTLAGFTRAGIPLTGLDVVDNDGHSVLASSPAYADAVTSGSGLGASPAFTAAVPDAAGATFVAYADIAKLVQLYGDEIPQAERDNFAALASLGLSVVVNDGSSDLRLRLTTK